MKNIKHATATNTNDATCQLQILIYVCFEGDSVSFLLCKGKIRINQLHHILGTINNNMKTIKRDSFTVDIFVSRTRILFYFF